MEGIVELKLGVNINIFDLIMVWMKPLWIGHSILLNERYYTWILNISKL